MFIFPRAHTCFSLSFIKRIKFLSFLHYYCSCQQSKHRNLCLFLGFRILMSKGNDFFRSIYKIICNALVCNGIYVINSLKFVNEPFLTIFNQQCLAKGIKMKIHNGLIWYSILVEFPFPLRVLEKGSQKTIKNAYVPSLFWWAVQIIYAANRASFIHSDGIWKPWTCEVDSRRV